MKKIYINDIEHSKIKGVQVQMPNEGKVYSESYFEWKASELRVKFKEPNVTGGILTAWHNEPLFSEIETHKDAEMFYFISGTAIMLFIDLYDGVPDIETAQIVRIKEGTQIIIEPGKGHFVAVAESVEPVQMIVVAPPMKAPRKKLDISLKGIYK